MARKVKDTRKPAPTNLMKLRDAPTEMGAFKYRISYTPETGGEFVGTEEEINALLTALGYHEIAIRTNLMSRVPFIEAKLTPVYCSPAFESYWSM